MRGAVASPKSHHSAGKRAEFSSVASRSVSKSSFRCVFWPKQDALSWVAQKHEYSFAAGDGVPNRVMTERTEKRPGFADTLCDGGSNPRTYLYNHED